MKYLIWGGRKYEVRGQKYEVGGQRSESDIIRSPQKINKNRNFAEILNKWIYPPYQLFLQ
jgi:hypothetical protein